MRPSLQLDIHVFDVEGLSSDGRRFEFVKHSLVTLDFEDVSDLETYGSGPQNVLDALPLSEQRGPFGRYIHVTLPSNNGLGGDFKCQQVAVLDVVPFEPPERSVYRR